MAIAVYTLCAVTSAASAAVLLRVFWRHRDRATRLVLWSGCCFVCLAISNGLAFVDGVLAPGTNLATARAATACLGPSLLLIAPIWESE
jgi:hypothetical protein